MRRRIFDRLAQIVITMGGIAVIDELEIDLDPHALPCIIGLFANPETNPKGSQLLFTSHSLEVLNHLEKEQIILVEKKKDCKSNTLPRPKQRPPSNSSCDKKQRHTSG